MEDGQIKRLNLSEWKNYEDFETHQPAAAPSDGETHSGADVAIFATGQFKGIEAIFVNTYWSN